MKIKSQRFFEGKNIYSHKKVIRMDVDLEGFCETPSKDIKGFNENLLDILPELREHRCGIDENHGFHTRLKEGTYLAHICEHMIIAMQNRIGINVAYGKAREIEGDLYYIIFEYEYKNCALAIANLAIDIINSLIAGVQLDVNKRIELIEKIFIKEMMGPSTKAINDSAKRQGMPVMEIGEGVYQIGYGKKGRVFSATIGANTSAISVDMCCDKYLTKKVLKMNSIPVANGYKVTNTIELLKSAQTITYPLVLKPQFGSKGAGVYVNIKNEVELLKAFSNLTEKTKDIILEEYIEGKDYRVCVVDYKVVAVSHRTPPCIVGNGTDSIRDLIVALNQDENRGNGHEKPLTKIKLDKELDANLKKHKLDINSVLEKGEKVCLRENANLSTGGFAEDCTNLISEENIKICERTAKALGLDICGIDILTNNISKSLNDYGIVIEVNAAPGIRMHEIPACGEKRNVSDSILRTMYPTGISNIPVISVTGTNGKTTTTRLISYVISLMGYTVGMTSTDGVVIGNEFIHKGDDTGAESAKSVLLNRDVDYAVLETARGGIVKRGLAYELADVAVVTNISEDHLGIDGINTVDELAFTKSLVVEAVKKCGYAVINGDDKYCGFMIERARKYGVKTIIYSMDKENKFIQNNIKLGIPSVYKEDEFIVVNNKGKEYKICDYRYMPLTIDGMLKHNIYNALAACGALVGVGMDYVIISKGFLKFKSDEVFNSGRFNIYNVEGREIIFDYGHNIGGYKAIIESLEAMGRKNVSAVIGVPGDRSNSNIKRIGSLSAESFSKIYVKEDKDRRNRNPNEVAELLVDGIKEIRDDLKNVSVILDENEALEAAFNDSNEGDTIIVFYEEYKNVLKKLKKLSKTSEVRA
ncbi:MAG: cyanophycin synthetase [Sarcina sp.]